MPYPVILTSEPWGDPRNSVTKTTEKDEPISVDNFWTRDSADRFGVGLAVEDRILDLEATGVDVSSLALPFAKFIMMNSIVDGTKYTDPNGLLDHLKNN